MAEMAEDWVVATIYSREKRIWIRSRKDPQSIRYRAIAIYAERNGKLIVSVIDLNDIQRKFIVDILEVE